uniref:Uncharacterized protein n=1 Tax=Avena sativa TaxID=4498 RepID=A0ACD5TBJ0_AVESA
MYRLGAPLRRGMEQREVNFHLYMRQQTEGTPGANEKGIVFARQPNAFGDIYANDWTMYDGHGSDAKLVARAQGVHTGCDMNQADSWLVCLNIEFVDERFKGSSLKVVGNYKTNKGQWAIVGGTGEFAFAQGVATFKICEQLQGGNIREFRIRCVTLNFPKPIKEGLFGAATSGKGYDIPVAPERLQSVTIRSDHVIHSIAYSYIDVDGEEKTAGQWGGSGGHETKIVFAPSETVKKIVGTTGLYKDPKYQAYHIVTSLSIITNVQTYGPFGKALGDSFSAPAKDTDEIVGFFARAGLWLDAIGVYVRQN